MTAEVSATNWPLHCFAFALVPAVFLDDTSIGVSSLSHLIPSQAGVLPSIASTLKFSSLKNTTLLPLPVLFFFQFVFLLRAKVIKYNRKCT